MSSQLPLIVNAKTVDPTDSSSASVYQLETAMGAAIGLFEDAVALEVDRQRFFPVKTNDDLQLLRSSHYRLNDKYKLEG
jgi:UTP--glucose-1-phosphate uridylyltransferase